MWTTLKSADDWAAYQKKTAKELQILPERVNWGPEPTDYPCLVSTLFPPRPPGTDPKSYSAFVYMADAEELFEAAGRKFVEQGTVLPPNQAQYNRWIAAMVLALVNNDINTGLFAPKGGEEANKAAFEEKLLEAIELVDDYTRGKKDELKWKLTSTQITVLDTLEPPR